MPLGVRTHKAAVFERLASMIVELELPPGTRLVESELSALLHVSKTPVREALLLLESEGLVEIKPYQGAAVTWLSVDEYREIHFLLDALELPAVALVIESISRRDLQAAGQLVKRAERARLAEDSLLFGELTTQIHQRLFSAAPSRRLTRFVSALVARPGRRYARVFQHQFADAWDVEMAVVKGRYQGIANGDPEEAAAVVRGGHAQLIELARGRTHHPLVQPYLNPAHVDAGVRVIPLRRSSGVARAGVARRRR